MTPYRFTIASCPLASPAQAQDAGVPFVRHALGRVTRSITLPDGKDLMREFEAGDVPWSEEQPHIGENAGQTPTHVVPIGRKKSTARAQPSDVASPFIRPAVRRRAAGRLARTSSQARGTA